MPENLIYPVSIDVSAQHKLCVSAHLLSSFSARSNSAGNNPKRNTMFKPRDGDLK